MNALRTLPRVHVELDGAPLAAADAAALGEVRVQQRLSLPAQCELRFFDPRGDLGTGAGVPAGAALRVRVQGHAEPLFTGQVTAAEYVYGPAHERELRLRGYDLLHRLRKRRPVRAHVQVNLLELARELVASLGITVEATEPGPFLPKLIQHRQSDLDLLVEAGERCGLYLTLRGDVLHLLTLRGLGTPSPLVLGESLLEARFEVNGDPACRSVSAVGWDPLRVEPHRGQARVARVGRQVAAAVPPERVGGSGERSVVNQAFHDDRQAEALAQAELDAGVAREVTLEGVAEGDPRLRPGARVTVRGVAAAVAGTYVLTAVTHTCDARQGFVSQLDTAPPAGRTRAGAATATLGVVTQLDDPEKLGRVRVSLPAYGNVETDWLGVLAVGAGAGKGLMALPDAGDHVLVLFTHEDTAQGVVLGGLYGAGGPPDAGLEGGAVRRYTLQTPGGQRVRLDDSRKVVRIENSDGSYIELSPDKVRLHAQQDLEIEAPGRAVVIRGRSIDFARG